MRLMFDDFRLTLIKQENRISTIRQNFRVTLQNNIFVLEVEELSLVKLFITKFTSILILVVRAHSNTTVKLNILTILLSTMSTILPLGKKVFAISLIFWTTVFS